VDFSSKLNQLMLLMGTNNNRLAKALNVDPSLISRWRSGKRPPRRVEGPAYAIAGYYMRSTQSDYQRQVLMDLMQVADQPMEEEERVLLLASWLSSDAVSKIPDSPKVYSNENTPKEKDVKLHMYLPDEHEGSKALSAFIHHLEYGSSEHVILVMSQVTGWMTGGELYEEWYSALRLILLEGGRVDFVLGPMPVEINRRILRAWLHLAPFGNFTIRRVFEELPILRNVVLCSNACAIFDLLPGDKRETEILIEDPILLSAIKDPVFQILAKSAISLQGVTNVQPPQPENISRIRIYRSFHAPMRQQDFSGIEVLMLPAVSAWQNFLEHSDERVMRGRLRYVQENLTLWMAHIQSQPQRPFRLIIDNKYDCIQAENLELSAGASVLQYHVLGNPEKQAVLSDQEWYEDLPRMLMNESEYLSDTAQILRQLNLYCGRLYSQYGNSGASSFTLSTESDLIRLIHDPSFGNCMIWKDKGYYTVEGNRILIFSMGEEKESAEGFIHFLQEYYPTQEIPMYFLQPLEQGRMRERILAQDLGFVPTGFIAFQDGSLLNEERTPLPNERLCMEMRYREENLENSRG